MSTQLKSVFLAESSQVTDQIGNAFVLNLYARLREIEALARSLALTVEQLPRSESLLHQVIPAVLNFQGDLAIAGGGAWFEPTAFGSGVGNHGFFWGRNAEETLVYFDDYNQADSGYCQEPWYVIGRYARPGQCLWSKSYQDPYSQELMITCTVPIFEENTFIGVVTVDLKLEELQATVDQWQKKTGGYIFILDRNNQFIAFPDLDQVKRKALTSPESSTEVFISIRTLAEEKPLFLPLLSAVEEMDTEILSHVDQTPPSRELSIAHELSQQSPQITDEEGRLLEAILRHSPDSEERTDYLYQKFEIDKDSLLQEPAIAFLYDVPQVYWKVFIVKPRSEMNAATYSLIQADKMATLGQMLAGIAHELNNPLNFIVANLTYAKTYVDDLLAVLHLYQRFYPNPVGEVESALLIREVDFLMQDLPKLLDSMQVGADRTAEIIKALRNFSRPDEERSQNFNLHKGINDTLLLLNDRIRGKANQPGIEIIRDYGDLPLIQCFPGQLSQVFTNLIVNALDALEDQIKGKGKGVSLSFSPKIQIRTRVVNAAEVVISIKDNGPGIPPEVKQRLFQPFFTTKPRGKGTGLGLAICRQIITERHGGSLRCESNPGAGAEFIVTLPIHLETLEPSPDRALTQP